MRLVSCYCFMKALGAQGYSLDLDSSRKEGKKEERVSLWMSWNSSRILNLGAAAARFPLDERAAVVFCCFLDEKRSRDQLPEDETQHVRARFQGIVAAATRRVFFKVTVEHKKPCNFSFQRLLVFWYSSLSFNPNGNLYVLNWIPLICSFNFGSVVSFHCQWYQCDENHMSAVGSWPPPCSEPAPQLSLPTCHHNTNYT